MTVRGQDRRKRAGAGGAIEIAGDVELGQALEVHLEDGIVAVSALAEDLRAKRRFVWRRQPSGGCANVITEI